MLVGALAVFLGLAGLLVTVLTAPRQPLGSRATPRRLLRAAAQEGKRSSRRLQSSSADLKDSAVAMTDQGGQRPTSRPASPSAWPAPAPR